MTFSFSRPFAALIFVLVAGGLLAAPPRTRRALPPKWTQSTRDVFFDDARTKLVGNRPDRTAGGDAPAMAESGAPSDTAAGGQFAWSKLISAEVLEDEIKSMARELEQDLASVTKFKSGSYKGARMHLSVLATMFGVIGEYDGDVRWKKEAPALRDLLARAGFNCKVGTDPAFKEAKARSVDLEALIRGSGLSVAKSEPAAKWSAVTGRPPLMQRMEAAQQQGLSVWTASAGELTKNSQKALHEAQLITALAYVIRHEGFESADDDSYLGFAKALQQHASEAAGAIKQGDYGRARKEVGEIEKSCSACHEGFRG